MKRRIFKHQVILVVTAIILTFLSMSWFMYNNLSEQMQEAVKDECQVMAYAVNTYGEEYVEKAGTRTESRVTLIASDGSILYDSVEEESSMEARRFPVTPTRCRRRRSTMRFVWTMAMFCGLPAQRKACLRLSLPELPE